MIDWNGLLLKNWDLDDLLFFWLIFVLVNFVRNFDDFVDELDSFVPNDDFLFDFSVDYLLARNMLMFIFWLTGLSKHL